MKKNEHSMLFLKTRYLQYLRISLSLVICVLYFLSSYCYCIGYING